MVTSERLIPPLEEPQFIYPDRSPGLGNYRTERPVIARNSRLPPGPPHQRTCYPQHPGTGRVEDVAKARWGANQPIVDTSLIDKTCQEKRPTASSKDTPNPASRSHP